jgi:hypothetical protein
MYMSYTDKRSCRRIGADDVLWDGIDLSREKSGKSTIQLGWDPRQTLTAWQVINLIRALHQCILHANRSSAAVACTRVPARQNDTRDLSSPLAPSPHRSNKLEKDILTACAGPQCTIYWRPYCAGTRYSSSSFPSSSSSSLSKNPFASGASCPDFPPMTLQNALSPSSAS